MAKEAKEIINIRMKPSLIDRIDKIAEQMGDSRGQVIEMLVRDALPGAENYLAAYENPIMRDFVSKAIESAPLMKLVAMLDGDALSDEDIADIRNRVQTIRENARKKAGKVARS